ncbi:2-hydroxyacyl-CoA dehydratase [Shuttleworthella satelles]|uniref:CoA-substrate-specific enzyme activase n=1 Tax=Shuttleworthella satelles DSM 14600 TaxID=626523 RepID=C4G8V0_9FIRM|nr:2-hydroxyacyl-CoA dehydratase [Shuttleworthia satelles]EEP29047.1 putative CoA-substrate-specific enzyme activase [Shuttleworthia satelles DSM 14600]
MANEKFCKLGIDIGSTTVKIALLDEENHLLFSDYERHFANIRQTLKDLIEKCFAVTGDVRVSPVITGSGGLTLAKHLGIPFEQEVVAVATSLQTFLPKTDVAIELGGEDAKIIYFENGNVEQRMNGVCAGGTGSFIDQMASLIQTDASGLNEYAKNYKSLYQIASRCGVFAKTDIQPLINEGATREDLAASIFQAVVNQTISGLACGKPIRGHVAFLGGPLHFLDQLRQAFVRTLHLDEEHALMPDNSHLFAAMGSALNCHEDLVMDLAAIREKLSHKIKMEIEVARMEPLFDSEDDYNDFLKAHGNNHVHTAPLEEYHGRAYLGIDSGSTTTKLALVSEDGDLLYSFYSNNKGNPLETARKSLEEIYEKLPSDARIVHACSTGYGEALMKSALKLEEGEVETVAHFYAAQHFDPQVDCILDIGGQDMKCIKIKDNMVDSVQLNEACSAGCGSFLETFAKSLNLSIQDFAKEARYARQPIDLGTRCTVFMNSKVKQAQKEGASVADISSGLAYSVIKNALFKVIKLSDASDLGQHVVVQGGTFYNDAVFRAFERISGVHATRPDIAGIMGAFGAALIAKERYRKDQTTTMLSIDEIRALTYTTHIRRCQFCNNHCILTEDLFNDGRVFITGNRCERGLGLEKNPDHIPNLFDYKFKRIFRYAPLKKEEATRGTIGIPRALNMYENYPLWATFLTELGFRIQVSPMTNRKIYELGIESIPSESECYPAKLTHGHIQWLINKGVDAIWYPDVPYERNEFPDANNNYNCPIVTSYAENIKNNVDEISSGKMRFLNPFVALSSEEIMTDQLIKYLAVEMPEIPEEEIRRAAHAGWLEMDRAREDIRKKGEEVLDYLQKNKRRGIVLAGRPYHVDPEINHGIADMITSYGIAVLTEDSVSHLGHLDQERPVIVMDQWMYHTRMYAAANFVKKHENLDLIQLNSFGCGLDAVTTDQVADILTGSGKIYTCLKIDEVNNLGAARIRLRSLLAAIRVREERRETREVNTSAYERVVFTKEMKKKYTILAPQMSPIHFDLLMPAFNAAGYNLVLPDVPARTCVDVGLKYVNNDACYPSLIVVGQFMAAVKSGKYDMDQTAILISQTGGGCRASNYIGFIRRALIKAGYPNVPVISINLSGLEPNPGFSFTPSLIQRGLYALEFGDIFLRCLYRVRPYELVAGSADALHEKWAARVKDFVSADKKILSHRKYKQMCRDIIHDFDTLPIHEDMRKPRVGIVGEILVKYHPVANNDLVSVLEHEGAEAVVPDLTDFLLYCFYNTNFKAENLGFSQKSARLANMGIKFFEWLRKTARQEFEKSSRFTPPAHIEETAARTTEIVSLGNQTGEGWFLTGEMLELVHDGCKNVICIQPFGCLPNHIVGKGVIKKIRHLHPDANISAIDYDPGASEVNQLNRIKLMLATANKNLEAELAAQQKMA